MTSATGISVDTTYLTPSDPSLPALALQTTRLVDSYMLWVGAPEGGPEDVHKAALQGSLCKDWACAMPPKIGISFKAEMVPATSLFRSSSSDIALSMAQRLAKRFKKQIFLSVDVPSSFLSVGAGPRLLLEAERGIVATLVSLESLQALTTGE